MSDSLTTLIAKVQVILGDDGTIFTTAKVTAAVRQALQEFNLRNPQFLGTTITGIDDQYEYELTDTEALSVKIIDVLKESDNQDEIDTPLTYDEYIEDERVFFRLRQPITSSETLIVRYTQNHIINGLDSQTESTIQAQHDQIIVDGACYWCIITRAVSRVESINLSKDQSDNYREIAGHFKAAFTAGMANAARKQAAVGEPDTRSWSDNWSGWNQ
jgi:hypothetical protein